MAQLATYDAKSGAAGRREFGAALGDGILYRTLKDAVVMYQSNRRQSDAHTKTRSELAGHAKKPWKQKHTGRARHGDRRSPLWVGGATVFGPRNKRRWNYALPRRQKLVALRSALAGKLQDGEVHEVANLAFPRPSAKDARKLLAGCGCTGSVLVLLARDDANAWKSFRNFPRVSVRSAREANAYDLLAHRWLVAQAGALEALVARTGEAAEAE
jgi:large subunit ribosomal protein L4